MKKLLVLLLVTSSSAFAQQGGFGYGGSNNNERLTEHPFIREMSKAQQDQLSALKEKFLKDSQAIKQKYDKEVLALKLDLKKIESQIPTKDSRGDSKKDNKGGAKKNDVRGEKRDDNRNAQQRGISPEHAKIILQAQEIKMQIQEIERKSRNEIETLKTSVEQTSHKIYKEWADSL